MMIERYFARIENEIVIEVIVASAEFISLKASDEEWVETFEDGGMRGNYAGIGYVYDRQNDKFYPTRPFPSWELDQDWNWQAPIPKPENAFTYWDEILQDWCKIT